MPLSRGVSVIRRRDTFLSSRVGPRTASLQHGCRGAFFDHSGKKMRAIICKEQLGVYTNWQLMLRTGYCGARSKSSMTSGMDDSGSSCDKKIDLNHGFAFRKR